MIKAQVNRYKNAVGTRSTKSDPGREAMAHTRNTAIGSDRAITTRSRRGSWEGYSQATSVHLGSPNRGYLAEANQIARNRNKYSPSLMSANSTTRNPVSHVGFMNRNFVDHSMLGAKGSSIRQMQKRLELDRLV